MVSWVNPHGSEPVGYYLVSKQWPSTKAFPSKFQEAVANPIALSRYRMPPMYITPSRVIGINNWPYKSLTNRSDLTGSSFIIIIR